MGPRICLSNKFPEAADAAGQDHTLRTCDLQLFSKKSRERGPVVKSFLLFLQTIKPGLKFVWPTEQNKSPPAN